MGRRPLVRRRWRRGSPSPARQGMPPPAPRPPRPPRQSRPRSRTLLGPVVPREPSEGLARPPHCRVRMSLAAVLYRGLAHPFRFAPVRPSMERHGASVPSGCISPCDPPHFRIAHRGAPGHRLPQAAVAAPVPDFHRPSVVQSIGRLLPTTWPQGHRWTASEYARHQVGTRTESLAARAAVGRNADLAPRHYRIAPPGDMPRKSTSAASATGTAVTGHCASCPAQDTTTARGSPPRRAAGARRLQDAPTALDGHQPHQRIVAGALDERLRAEHRDQALLCGRHAPVLPAAYASFGSHATTRGSAPSADELADNTVIPVQQRRPGAIRLTAGTSPHSAPKRGPHRRRRS